MRCAGGNRRRRTRRVTSARVLVRMTSMPSRQGSSPGSTSQGGSSLKPANAQSGGRGPFGPAGSSGPVTQPDSGASTMHPLCPPKPKLFDKTGPVLELERIVNVIKGALGQWTGKCGRENHERRIPVELIENNLVVEDHRADQFHSEYEMRLDLGRAKPGEAGLGIGIEDHRNGLTHVPAHKALRFRGHVELVSFLGIRDSTVSDGDIILREKLSAFASEGYHAARNERRPGETVVTSGRHIQIEGRGRHPLYQG